MEPIAGFDCRNPLNGNFHLSRVSEEFDYSARGGSHFAGLPSITEQIGNPPTSSSLYRYTIA